jgi:hypothetical protein
MPIRCPSGTVVAPGPDCGDGAVDGAVGAVGAGAVGVGPGLGTSSDTSLVVDDEHDDATASATVAETAVRIRRTDTGRGYRPDRPLPEAGHTPPPVPPSIRWAVTRRR